MKRGTPDHPKMKALARALNIPIAYANGIMERIWHFSAEYAPDGGIGKYGDQDIAVECGYDGDPELLVSALLAQNSRWLDNDDSVRLIVHDWPEHCEDSVHCKLARAKKFFADGSAPKLSRLPKDERATAEAWYAQNAFVSARQALESAREARENAPTCKSKQLASASALALASAKPQPIAPTARVVAIPQAQPSEKFEEWWALWSSVKGTNHRFNAEQVYPREVTSETERDCFECTRSYLDSLDNPAKGYNPENFLMDQRRDMFKGRWPPRASPKSKPPSVPNPVKYFDPRTITG